MIFDKTINFIKLMISKIFMEFMIDDKIYKTYD
jgi:hypothetical protein